MSPRATEKTIQTLRERLGLKGRQLDLTMKIDHIRDTGALPEATSS